MNKKFLIVSVSFQNLLLIFFAGSIILACTSKAKNIRKVSRFAIIQTVDWFVKEDTLTSYIISDTNYCFQDKTIGGLRIAQFQIQNVNYSSSENLHGTNPLTSLEYFVYKKTDSIGIYFNNINSLGIPLKVDSVMGNKIDKHKIIDTISCLDKDSAVVYFDNNNDLVLSYFNQNKAGRTDVYDSVKLIYTSNTGLNNDFLSKKRGVYKNHFLYKIKFYFRKGFNEKINSEIPERNVEIKIIVANDFKENEIKSIIEQYRKTMKVM